MSFADIKGQVQALEVLRALIAQGKMQGSYLFSGPEGIGKKCTAVTLAKALNCLKGNADSCDSCASCLKIEAGQHPDVHLFLSDESEIKIDQIRLLQKDIYLKPYEGRVKVFILDNAHRLTADASNALLKVLEEPPKNSLIILTSDKPGLIYKTIISRCKTMKFSSLNRGELYRILKSEFNLDEQRAHFFAYFCEGRLGQAARLTKSEFFRQKNRVIDSFVLARRFNLEGFELKDRQEVRVYLNILASWFRDIYLLKTGMAHSEMIHLDRRNELLKTMGVFTFLDLNEILASISQAISCLDQNINTRLLLHDLGARLWKD